MDFTLNIYKKFLEALKQAGYVSITFEEYCLANHNNTQLPKRFVILRHDVDAQKENSLQFARIQHEKGIKGSYYFRMVPQSFDEAIIREIADMGHEIGYHYETMDTCKGNVDEAYAEFNRNIAVFRRFVKVDTICMHGSPRSKFDNKALWKKHNYRSLGILGEPYYDVDFNNVFYLTDTGRRWDGWKYSVRDKISQQTEWNQQGLVFHSTEQIIGALYYNKLPEKIMFTFHPQRWSNAIYPWMQELVLQKIKNIIKRTLVVKKS